MDKVTGNSRNNCTYHWLPHHETVQWRRGSSYLWH